MDKFAENIYNLCEAVIPYAPAVAVVALLLIGGMFAIPSDESRQKAKKSFGRCSDRNVLYRRGGIPWQVVYLKDCILNEMTVEVLCTSTD